MKYYSSSTFVAPVVAVAMVIICRGLSVGSARVVHKAGEELALASVPIKDIGQYCFSGQAEGSDGNYPGYVENVLSTLETVTPNTPTLSCDSYAYPDLASGNPIGSSNCTTTDIARCEACLSGFKTLLEACKFDVGGGLQSSDCIMLFWQIP